MDHTISCKNVKLHVGGDAKHEHEQLKCCRKKHKLMQLDLICIKHMKISVFLVNFYY